MHVHPGKRWSVRVSRSIQHFFVHNGVPYLASPGRFRPGGPAD